LIILYDKDECPFCFRVRLSMGAVGVRYERRPHDTPDHRAAWQALTAAKTVPVLVDGDPQASPVVLTDSSVILEYQQDRYGGLLPDDPVQRARARELVRYADVPLGRSLREVVFEKRDRAESEWDEARIEAGIAGYLATLPHLERVLGDQEHFLGRYTMADAALTARFALGVAYGVPLPDTTPGLQRYYAARSADPFFAAAAPRRLRAS